MKSQRRQKIRSMLSNQYEGELTEISLLLSMTSNTTLNNQPPSGVVSLKVYLRNPHSNPQYTSPHYKFLSTSFPTIVLMPSPPRDCQENFVFRVFITLIWICKSRDFSWWYCCHQHLPHFIRHSPTKFINNLVPWVIKTCYC